MCVLCVLCVYSNAQAKDAQGKEVMHSMIGSKYTDEQRQQFAALLASGLSASAAGKELGIPKSTACAWAQRLIEESDDYAAERELEVRRMVKRCFKIARGSLGAIDKQVAAAAADGKRISAGLKVLAKAEKDGMVALTAEDIKQLREIIENYTGVGLRDLAATIKAVDEKQVRLEATLAEASPQAHQIELQLEIVDKVGTS